MHFFCEQRERERDHALKRRHGAREKLRSGARAGLPVHEHEKKARQGAHGGTCCATPVGNLLRVMKRERRFVGTHVMLPSLPGSHSHPSRIHACMHVQRSLLFVSGSSCM